MITKIKIEKFRQLENVIEENIGKVNELYGKNGCGKTSFINFINWVLIGETLDYGVNDDDNLDETNYYASIGGEITCKNNEKEYTFKRVYGYDEDTNKKTNDFYVNDRKVKNQSEYYSCVEECFNLNISLEKIKGFNLLRALSDVYYIGNSDNEKAFRDLITQLVGIDTDTILFSDDKFENIKKDYENNSNDYDKTKDFYNQELKKIEKDLVDVKKAIEEDSRYKFNEEELVKLENELKNNIIPYSNKELSIKESELSVLINELNNSILEDKLNEPKNDIQVKLEKLEKDYENKKKEYNDKVVIYNNGISVINIINGKLSELNKSLKEEMEKTFEVIKCPNCNTIINENGVKEFNSKKANIVKSIKEKIEASNKELKLHKDKLPKENEIVDMRNLLDSMQNDIKTLKLSLKEFLEKDTNILSSDKTKALKNNYNELYKVVSELKEKDLIARKEYNENNEMYYNELNDKIEKMKEDKKHCDRLLINKENKKVLLDNKSTYILRKQLLEEFKLEELELIKNETSKIFGNDFEFVMQEKNKSNDNYKKVCYAKVDGVKYSKSNTAQELQLGIIMVEKIKKFIGGCDLPIVFDIVDNIGKGARNNIFESATSQIFYTRIDDDDIIERELRIIKE